LPPRDALLAIPGAHLHSYGKDSRPGRKVGHCTIIDADRAHLLERLEALRAVVAGKE
jgi:5-(carboxyamino)imidazole ribonucleotide synthase